MLLKNFPKRQEIKVDKLFKIKKVKKNLKYHNLWTFNLVDLLIDEFRVVLTEILKPWQILEYLVYKVLTDLRLIIRYSSNHNAIKPLKNSDFVVFNGDGSILSVLECKFISDPKCNSLNSKIKFCKTVLNRYPDNSITYVVNDEFYDLLRETGLIRSNFMRVRDIPNLFKFKNDNTLKYVR